MRSLIIIEVEHGETTDGVQELAEYVKTMADRRTWSEVVVNDYTVRVDLPSCFRLDTGE